MEKQVNRRLVQLLITFLVLVNTALLAESDADENPVVEDRTLGALDFIVQTCSSLGNCQPLTTGLVVDNNWRGVYYNLCYDPQKCDKVIVIYKELDFSFYTKCDLHFRFRLSMSMKLYLD
jgi:hypothetical protein